MLVEFSAVINQAAEDYTVSLIANNVYDIVKEYNQFYHDFSILREEDVALRNFRLMLSKSVATTIKKGMQLLGIDVPDRM